MNLLVISNNFPNHDDTYTGDIFVKEQIKCLKNNFDNIYVISPIPYGICYLRKTKYENYEFDNVKVYFPRYLNFPPFYFWNRYSWVNFELKAITKLIDAKKMRFDIIHAHFTWPSGAVAVEMKKEFKVSVIITEHAHVSLYPLIKKKDRIIVNTWNKTDAIIRVNQRDIPLFTTIIPKEKLFYIPNGYTLDRIKHIPKRAAREKLGLPLDKRILFNLAALYPYKGHRYLIQAIEEVVKIRKDILCIIGGKGPLKKSLEKQIKPMKNFIKLLGFIPEKDIPYLFNAADIFVLSSLSEGNPTVMFEALGVGLPFIGTRVGGVPEIITSRDYGLLCEPAKPKDLAEKILIGLEKEWDREKILEYAQQFTWANIANEIMEIYNELLI